MTSSTEQPKKDVPQPPPTTPIKAQKLVSPTSAMIPKAVNNLANGTSKGLNLEDNKNMTQNKRMKLSNTSKNTSAKKLRLPKLVSTTPQEIAPTSKVQSNVILPKLIEPSSEVARVAH
ncbi:uncharacterized protein LOC143184093 [Calliopsis andreniformis]|uniref:uncharacterized protein LOC143184093 n=1 Tax=Calliopsis andreniformis TaxID=337506 RepID=UPI003FCC83DF